VESRSLPSKILLEAHYLLDRLVKETPVKRVFSGPIFNEFVVELPIEARKGYRKGTGKGHPCRSGSFTIWLF